MNAIPANAVSIPQSKRIGISASRYVANVPVRIMNHVPLTYLCFFTILIAKSNSPPATI